MAGPTTQPPAPPRSVAPRLLWLLTGALVVAVAVIVFLLLRDDPAGIATGTPAPAEVSPDPTEATAAPEPEPEPEPTEALPLRPFDDHVPESGASAIPLVGESLADGDYFGFVRGVDPAAGTVDVDIAVFYNGQAAIDWLDANDPDAENPPPNDYLVVNQVTTTRTLDLSADVRIWDWCFAEGDEPPFVERTVGSWAAAPQTGELSCAAGDAMGRDPAAVYWVDVRDGAVIQVIGQYLP